MIEQVATAFDHQDYQEAARLLKALPATDPWVQLYQGRLYEVTEQTLAAEAVYRQLLRTAIGAKITLQARQGLQRLEARKRERQRLSIAQATATPENNEPGLLVLEPVSLVAKSLAAPKFAQVMNIDPYSARLQLPSQGWRIYRTGAIGKLQFYGQALQAVGIPAFWFALREIQQIQVLQVCYFQTNTAAQATVNYTNPAAQLNSLTFPWSEVTQRVEGLLPLFEEVIDLDARGRLQRKQKTQDYAQICDLHLPSQNTILRFYDSGYQFHQGMSLSPQELSGQLEPSTSWTNWKNLREFLNQHLHPAETNFKFFAETALEHVQLHPIDSHINLFRRAETDWDQVFHLYSCLILLRNKQLFGLIRQNFLS